MTLDALNSKLSEIWPRRWPVDATEGNGFTGFKGAVGQILCTENNYKQVRFHMPLSTPDEEVFRQACDAIRDVENGRESA